MDIGRRELILAAGAGALSVNLASAAGARQTGHTAPVRDGYFLSARNPTATTDQRELDALAIELFATPEMRTAQERTAADFARVSSNLVGRETWAMFNEWIASFCFRSILMAVNSDANFPKVLRVYSPAARWLGNDVPESRWGNENPDNCYRIIPMEFGGRYVVKGQRQPNPPSHSSYVLVADTDTSVTEGLIEMTDMEVAPDGTFTITVDETPANGRRNHIQMTRHGRYLFNRDTMSDWMQTPHALRVERLNPPARGPLTREEILDRASRIMHDGVKSMFYWQWLLRNIPEGTLKQPHRIGPSGGLLTQLSSSGWLKLGEDEAFVITVDPLDASYFSIVSYDLWGRTREYRDHQTSLNTSQMAADANGQFTFVLSSEDPGIHNWIDTMGLHELSEGFRWQGISPTETREPKVTWQKVPLANLSMAIPRGVAKVTPKQRTAQLDARRRGYDRRFIDN